MSEINHADYYKLWRDKWLYSLAELADSKLQQRWLDDTIRSPAWTYVEFRCRYFDDVNLSEGYEYWIKNGYLTKEEYDCVSTFHQALDAYEEPNGHYDPVAILNDPKWLQIVSLAQQSIKELKKILSSQVEINILTDEHPPLEPGDYTWPN